MAKTFAPGLEVEPLDARVLDRIGGHAVRRRPGQVRGCRRCRLATLRAVSSMLSRQVVPGWDRNWVSCQPPSDTVDAADAHAVRVDRVILVRPDVRSRKHVAHVDRRVAPVDHDARIGVLDQPHVVEPPALVGHVLGAAVRTADLPALVRHPLVILGHPARAEVRSLPEHHAARHGVEPHDDVAICVRPPEVVPELVDTSASGRSRRTSRPAGRQPRPAECVVSRSGRVRSAAGGQNSWNDWRISSAVNARSWILTSSMSPSMP